MMAGTGHTRTFSASPRRRNPPRAPAFFAGQFAALLFMSHKETFPSNEVANG